MIKARGWNKGNVNSENEGEQRVGGCRNARYRLKNTLGWKYSRIKKEYWGSLGRNATGYYKYKLSEIKALGVKEVVK